MIYSDFIVCIINVALSILQILFLLEYFNDFVTLTSFFSKSISIYCNDKIAPDLNPIPSANLYKVLIQFPISSNNFINYFYPS